MVRLLLASGATLLVAVATATASTTPLQGTFKTVIANAPNSQLDGLWQVDLLAGGRYTIQENGVVLIRGHGTRTATTISFGHESGPAACTGLTAAATYKWSLRAGLLHLTVVRESCVGRHVVLTTHALLKTG